MKRRSLLFFTLLCLPAFAKPANPLATPLTLDLNGVLKLVQENMNGWTKLVFDGDKTLFTPQRFYARKVSDPKQWVSQIRELGFCQPSKVWKDFPVLSASNDAITGGIEQVALHPEGPASNVTMQMVYSETVVVGGKARNVSYDFAQNGANVNVSCSATNELGEVQTIQQAFDLKHPEKFDVKQKKNGKLLEI